MASIYRFKRKGKEEHAKSHSSEEQNNGYFPLLFDVANAPSQERIKEAREGEDVKTESAVEKAAESVAESAPAPQEKEVPQELLDALTVDKVDSKKLNEVFRRPEKSDGEGSIPEDQTIDLLKEIFGSSPAKEEKAAAKEAKTEEVAETVLENAGDALEDAGETAADEQEIPEQEIPQNNDDYIADHDGEDEKTRDYIAVHNSDDESTRVYHPATDLGEIAPEGMTAPTNTLPPLSGEMNLPDAGASTDPYSDTYDEIKSKAEAKPVLPEEYTSPEEYDEFAEHLRNRNFRNLCSVLWTFFSLCALLYLESACFSRIPHPAFLKPGGIYNVIFLLVDVQLIFISALLCLSSLGEGLKKLFQGKPDRNTLTFFMHLFPALHAILLLVLDAKEYPLFGCVGALFAFLNAIANFLDSKRLYRTFRICGRKGEKLVAKALDEDSPEAEAFRDQLEGEPKFFSIQKAEFIENFFRRSRETGKAERGAGWVLLFAFLFSAAFAGFSYWKEPSVAQTATSFMIMAVMTMPLSGVFTTSLPFSHLSAKAEKNGAAIVSTSAADEYAAADVVSFTDKEIFPPKSVKVTTIRTYGQTRIDKAILYSAMIFQKLGGPLSEVFKKTISGVYDKIPEDLEFREITADGMCARIEDQDVFVGNKDYLLSYDFGYTKDDQDETFEEKNGKIMYMVIGSQLAAKFYIRYSISKQFKKTVLTLYRAGICPAVKTCDPNIDSDLFRTLLQDQKIPAGIIKSCEAMKDAPAMPTSESGVVCTSSIAKMLRTFSFCESLRHLIRANVVMKILSLFLGAGIVCFLFYIGNLTRVTGLFALIYQLLWLIPVTVPSLVE